MEDSFFKKLLKSRLVFLGLLALGGMIIYQVGSMSLRLWSLQKEVAGLRQKISENQKKNESLKQEIDYAGAAGFFEREAKSRLNLKNPGEEVVVIVPEKDAGITLPSDNRGIWKKVWEWIISF